MINKDYILRLAQIFGRELAIILRLRKRNRQEDALIYVDELFLRATGFTSGFINSASEEMLLNLITCLGALNVEKCLWIAMLLKTEGDIYVELDKTDEAYHRYLKSLHFFLEVLLLDNDLKDLNVAAEIEGLLQTLEDYELPLQTKSKLFRYYEKIGRYAKAEDLLFEIVDAGTTDNTAAQSEIVDQGRAFYARLIKKSEADLQAGDLSREEIEEGSAQLKELGER